MKEFVRLGDYITQIRGISYKPDNIKNSNDPDAVAILRAHNIQDVGLNFEDLVYIDKECVNEEQFLRKGDILICSSSGSKNLVGKAAVVKENLPYAFGAFCKVVRVKNINEEYAGQYFQSPHYRKEISILASGANINNIRNEHIDEMIFPLYTEDRQKNIAKELTHIDILCNKRRKQLCYLEQLIKARFVELFGSAKHNHQGYPVVKIGSCAKLQGGFAFKSSDYLDDGIRLVQISNVNKDTLDWDSINCVPQSFLQKYKDFELHVGDLVLAMTRPVIKSLDAVKIATVSEDDVPSLLNQRVGRFVIDKAKLNSVYLMLSCQMPEFREYVEAMSGNSLQPNISSKQVEDYSIVLPPLALQEQFAVFVEQTDKSKLAVQKSLKQLETLKKSLMQQYFG